MITTAAEYNKHLYEIQSKYLRNTALTIPENEPIYDVNLDTRTIAGPSILSAAQDHRAEVIYFRIPRYVDSVIDLSEMVGVVQYVNANNVAGIYTFPFLDTKTEEGNKKMLCPWCLSGDATEKAGSVKYNIVFYKIQPSTTSATGYSFSFRINTQPTTGKILYGMDVSEELREEYEMDATILDEVNQRLKEYGEAAGTYWLDLSSKTD